MKHYTIGVDVGGTNVKFGLISSSGKIISRSRLSTKKFIRNKTKLINAIIGSIEDFIADNKLTKKNVLGIGIGLPGSIDPKRGVVNYLPNIPGWKNVPLKRIIQSRLRIPTFIDNDVNLVTLGEWKFGAGAGTSNLLCITLGTGVGGGLILDNHLYRGADFAAGEIGHMPLYEKGPKCNCGGYGCFEQYVGNKTLLQKARKAFKKKDIRIEDVYRLAAKGNRKAVAFWDEMATHIGNAFVGVVNLLNPRLLIVGGGVSNNYRFLQATIKTTIKKRAMKVQGSRARVVRAKLGDDAGVIGTHVLVKDALF